jgi:ATP synthase protein I
MASQSPKQRGLQSAQDLGKYAGLGLQFALTVCVLGALGWWVDGLLGTRPWLLIVGIVLGAAGGFYAIVRAAPPAKPFHPSHPPADFDPPDSDAAP